MGLILRPVPKREWRQPSQRQTTFGIENVTRFSITARLDDGHIVWRGWFDDRDDADAFLWAMATGSLHYQPELWRLPTPWWHPDLGEGLTYDFLTNVFLTASPGSNQTFTSPSDWINASNSVETIGGGASGGVAVDNTGTKSSTGGGGGAWNKITNFSFAAPGTTTATYQCGVGPAGVFNGTNGVGSDGVNGGDTWFNATTLAGSSVGSKGGVKGTRANATVAGGAGGVGASGVGTSNNNGGRGGTETAPGLGVTGGGGAAGSSAAGGNGGDGNNPGGDQTIGGQGNGILGGLGGSGSVGADGTEWDATHGSGGGGGGLFSVGTGYAGGLYGGGGGGVNANTATGGTGGSGRQGIVRLSYGAKGAANMLTF